MNAIIRKGLHHVIAAVHLGRPVFSFLVIPGCLLLLCAQHSAAQDWYSVDIKGRATISVPPDLEIQSGAYKQRADDLKRKIHAELADLVLQPTGVNERFGDAGTYARVLINVMDADGDKFPGCDFEKRGLRGEVLASVREMTDQNIAELRRRGIKLLSSGRPDVYRTARCSMPHHTYDRQLASNPPVRVHMYMLMQSSFAFIITMSYRIEDEARWLPLYKRMLESIATR